MIIELNLWSFMLYGGAGTPAPTAPPVNTVAPVISGSPVVGATLSSTTGTWDNSPTFTYQWYSDATPIGGATSNSYLVDISTNGTDITCHVTGTNILGSATAVSNALPHSQVPVNTVAPVISGLPYTGQTLTTTNGTWNFASSFAYQWLANGANIGGATASTYLVPANPNGTTYVCRVTATNVVGSVAADSNTLTHLELPVNTVAPVVTGEPYQGQVLSTTDGTWNNSPSSFAYQWQVGGVDISGANSSTYTVTSTTNGGVIRCVVTGTNASGSANATSNTVSPAAAQALYSVRRMRQAYFGPAMRIRRSSDNTEQDINFNSDGTLDTAAITTFVGANSAFVVSWYDQSGNARTATQTTAGNQPRIVNAGVIETENALAAIFGSSVSNHLVVANQPLTGATSYTIFTVSNLRVADIAEQIFNQSSYAAPTGNVELRRDQSTNAYRILDATAGYTATTSVTNTHNTLTVLRSTNTNTSVWVRGTNFVSATPVDNTAVANSQCALLGKTNGTNGLRGTAQEILVFNAALSTSVRQAIDRSSGAYFGITVA